MAGPLDVGSRRLFLRTPPVDDAVFLLKTEARALPRESADEHRQFADAGAFR